MKALVRVTRRMLGSRPVSSVLPFFLVVSATDRDLWQGPKQEVRESRTSGFIAQPQKFETITVTISYKNGQLLRLRVTLAPARGLDPWLWPEGSQLWGRECPFYGNRSCFFYNKYIYFWNE